MLKAKKLGPQSYLDFIREELPTESTTVTRKDQSYWNSKNQSFQKLSFEQQQPNERYNMEQVLSGKYESELRLKRNSFRRTLLQMKSGQKQERNAKFIITDEDLNRHMCMRSPIHLQNKVDNLWNHLEKLDKKHLQQVYGRKTFIRQKKAISLIDANFEADIQLQQMKEQAKIEFRNKLLRNRARQVSDQKRVASQLCQLRQVKPEYQNLLLAEISIADKVNSPILFGYVKKYDPNLSIQVRKSQKQIESRSKSFQTQNTEGDETTLNKNNYNEFNESLQKFEVTMRQKCQYL